MRRFVSYNGCIYDANCIVYYCLYCEVPRAKESSLVIQDELTPLTRKITSLLVEDSKTIKTLQQVMTGVLSDVLTGAVKQLLSSLDIRRSLGFKRGERFDAMLELQIVSKCTKAAQSLQRQKWFQVIDYRASIDALMELTRFYRGATADAGLRGRLNPNKSPMPDHDDLMLGCFSRHDRTPLVTNDTHFTAFSVELMNSGLVTEIIALRSIQLPGA